MKINITPHQAALIQKRQAAVVQLNQDVEAAKGKSHVAMDSLGDILTAAALDGGMAEGVQLEQFTLTKEGSQDVLILSEKLKPAESE